MDYYEYNKIIFKKMFESNPRKFNNDNLYSFFPREKRLLYKQGINFISNANIANNPQNNNFLIINGLNATNNTNNKQIGSIKNFNSTNYKWNYFNYNYATNSNQNSILNSQKYTGFSNTGTNFYKNKTSQSSNGRKLRMNNGFKLRTGAQKKKFENVFKK